MERSLMNLLTEALPTREPKPQPPQDNLLSRNSSQMKLLWKALFIFGLYICSFPRAKNAGFTTPGFVWMSYIAPSSRFWASLGATMMICAMNNDNWLQRTFGSNVLQSLSKISFSLYLVHGPVLHLFGYSLVQKYLDLIGDETEIRFQSGVILAFVSLSPIMLWVADVFWRLVEKPCGAFVSHIERVCFVESK